VTEKYFVGSSSSGDISEALQAAIQAAKEGLPASLVHWTLDSIVGESGGFVEINTVSVKIKARPPQ
jgi:hypothetical protein